jgi:hypothetical protein
VLCGDQVMLFLFLFVNGHGAAVLIRRVAPCNDGVVDAVLACVQNAILPVSMSLYITKSPQRL